VRGATVRDFLKIAEQYIDRVLSGKELVCRLNRLAVERHVRDIKRANSDPAFPYIFDPKQDAIRFCRLFERVQPSKWPTPMSMGDWMVAHDIILYGWRMREPVQMVELSGKKFSLNPRRFRIAYDRWPRKTGKSAHASVQVIYHTKYDRERGAEVYTVALVEDQARRVFDEAVEMVKGTPSLGGVIKRVGDQPCRMLRVPELGAIAKPLSREKDNMEGKNISFWVGDEVHVWPGRGPYGVLRYGMRSRVQPLGQLITTAPSSDDTTSICNELDNYAEGVLTGVIPDERFFAWILEIDQEIKDANGNIVQEGDRWDDETTWPKACPNLGVTVKLEDMRQECLEAKNSALAKHDFLRYSLNIRTGSLDKAIQPEDWRACARPGDAVQLRKDTMTRLKGRICFAALDLASTDDTNALDLIFPPMEDGEKWELLSWFWIPADNIDARVDAHQVPYDVWREQGFIITTPGHVTDYDFIVGEILDLSRLFDLRELAYDPALASGLITRVLAGQDMPLPAFWGQSDPDSVQKQVSLLTKGWTQRGDKITRRGLKKEAVVKFAQTMMNYAAPCNDFVLAVGRRELIHIADPVLTWQINNLRWIRNHTGLYMPDKLKSVEKIDGAVAAIMAYGRATHPDNAKLIKAKPKVSTL
jgi:phage terminase large subunit-like protein